MLCSCLPVGGGSEVGGGAEAAGDRDTETAAGDGGPVSPERDGHPAGYSTGWTRYFSQFLLSEHVLWFSS